MTNRIVAACALTELHYNLKNLRNAEYWFYEQCSSFGYSGSLRTAKAVALELPSTPHGLSRRWGFWPDCDRWNFFYQGLFESICCIFGQPWLLGRLAMGIKNAAWTSGRFDLEL